MYTLEDDQETPTRLPRRASAPPTRPGSGLAPTQPARVEQPTGVISLSALPALAQSSRPGRGMAIAALLVACASVFVTSMDETVVVTALPKIIADPGINISLSQLDHAAWIISAYLLGFVIAMPLMGRVSDIFGRRRIMLLCLSIFGLGSVLCGLAPWLSQNTDIGFLGGLGLDVSSQGLVWLISARFIQAIGGGAVVPVAIAIVSDYFGQARLSLALGLIGAVTEAGGVVGPLYGAVIVQTLGWTMIFYLNVPIVLALMLGVVFCTPRHQRLRESIDWLGALLLGAALTCLSLGLAQQGTNLGPSVIGASVPQNNPLALIGALVFFALFIVLGRLKSWRVLRLSRSAPRVSFPREMRWPVVDLSLFTRLPFVAASLVSLFVGAALIIAMADIPLFVDTVLSQQVSQDSLALVSGLALLRMTAMIPVGAILGGWLCGRLSCRIVGVLGLLFTATGFYLMSRWPISVDWTQITISTLTAGLGFGLVVAPISTTALNAARSDQAGMGAAIITALRMVGMILGLAALTSWGLAFFKHLASQFPSLPANATSTEFTAWAQQYAIHLIHSAHTVYSSIFFTTMVLCLIALVPALFLWGSRSARRAAPVAATVAATHMQQSFASAVTASSYSPTVSQSLPPTMPGAGLPGGALPPRPRRNGGLTRKRLVIALVSVGLAMLLIGGGLTALMFWPEENGPASSAAPTATSAAPGETATPVAGPRMIELAMNSVALTSVFVSQLGLNDGAMSNMTTAPAPNDGLTITFDLNIKTSGLQRTLPVALDTRLALDKQSNLTLTVLHVRRDGQDAGPQSATKMQDALNQLILATVMPALHKQLQKAKLISIHTSASLGCGQGQEMLVLLIQAPPIQGIAAQPTPSALCFLTPIDLNKLLG